MNRCVRRRFLAVVCLSSALATPLPQAQDMPRRVFPAQALRAKIVIGVPPELTVNGAPYRLAPGARIRGETNMQVLSGELVGLSLVVHYTLNQDDQLQDVWILTEAERANIPWPVTVEQAQSWAFDPQTQTWTR